MKQLFSIAAIVFAFGCSKGGGDKILSDYEGFKDRMCKCADKACADKVTADVGAWMSKMADSMKDTKPTKEQDEKFDKIDDAMEECAKKFEAKEPEPTPPAGDTPPAEPPAGGSAAGSAGSGSAAAPATP